MKKTVKVFLFSLILIILPMLILVGCDNQQEQQQQEELVPTTPKYTVSYTSDKLIVTSGGNAVNSGDELDSGTQIVVTVNSTDDVLLVNATRVELDTNNQYTHELTGNVNLSLEQRLYNLPMGKYDAVKLNMGDSVYIDLTPYCYALYLEEPNEEGSGFCVYWDASVLAMRALGYSRYERQANTIIISVYGDGNYYDEYDDIVSTDIIVYQKTIEIVADGVLKYSDMDGTTTLVYNPGEFNVLAGFEDAGLGHDIVVDNIFNHPYNLFEIMFDSNGFLVSNNGASSDPTVEDLSTYKYISNGSGRYYLVSSAVWNSILDEYDKNLDGKPVDEDGNELSDLDIVIEHTMTNGVIHISNEDIGMWGDMLAFFGGDVDCSYVFWGKITTALTSDNKLVITFNYNYFIFAAWEQSFVLQSYNNLYSICLNVD